MSFVSKCKMCNVECNDKKCSECGATKFYLVSSAELDQDKNTGHFNHQLDGYPMYLNYANSPFDKPDLTNKLPRTFPIDCKISACIWNRRDNDEEFGRCDRHEAWNILDVENLEITSKNECLWYSGKGRGRTLSSIQAKL